MPGSERCRPVHANDTRHCRCAGPCYTSKVQQDYDLCSRCRQQPQAERAAPFARRQGRTRGQEDNGPALVKWCVQLQTGIVAEGAWACWCMQGQHGSVKIVPAARTPGVRQARTQLRAICNFNNVGCGSTLRARIRQTRAATTPGARATSFIPTSRRCTSSMVTYMLSTSLVQLACLSLRLRC